MIGWKHIQRRGKGLFTNDLCQTEISEFHVQVGLVGNENVFRLDVPVNNIAVVLCLLECI